jgi:ABC-type transporter Mla MlaB component
LTRKLLTLAGREGNMTIDLSAVRQCDSAGIAMLAACMAVKRRQQDHLRLVNVPARLTTLLGVYGLESVFVD